MITVTYQLLVVEAGSVEGWGEPGRVPLDRHRLQRQQSLNIFGAAARRLNSRESNFQLKCFMQFSVLRVFFFLRKHILLIFFSIIPKLFFSREIRAFHTKFRVVEQHEKLNSFHLDSPLRYLQRKQDEATNYKIKIIFFNSSPSYLI